MNLANTAPGRAPWNGPWGGLAPDGIFALSPGSGDVSLQLSFDWPVPAPPAPWMPEAQDSARHGAELAALLVILQTEAGFLPLYAEKPAPTAAEAWLPPMPLAAAAIPPPAAILAAPALTAMEFLAMEPVMPASAWLLL